jgi:anti-sigma regulatory factor (Ser/Thr protein kinase)
MSEWTFPATADSVPLARRLALQSLPALGPDVRDRVALVVSELVTNCVRHARTDFRLEVTLFDTEVHIEVSDQGAGRVDIKSPTLAEPHGRGLQIVRGLAHGWGVIPAPVGAGKTVWCDVAV